MFEKRILLFSELLKWYLTHGLVVGEIYQAIQFRPNATFKSFGESVSDARRHGDVDPSKQLLADTSKLIGNSSYGKLITNKDKHRKVSYLVGHAKTSAKLGGSSFELLEELDNDGLYELSEFKRSVSIHHSSLSVFFCQNLSFVSLAREPLADIHFISAIYFPQVVMDCPTHVGFVVLQYAKLRMLEFYYDFMDR